jgi:hypothetical protein
MRPPLLLTLLIISTIVLRLWQNPTIEVNPDTSAWISGAISAGQSPTPIWTLLTHSDSRPLTVLPLFLLEWVGIGVDWQVANWVNLLLWLGTSLVFYQILRRWMPSRQALMGESTLGTLPLLLVLAAGTEPDYLDYNSEAVCVPMLMVGLWWVLRLEKARAGWLSGLGLGTWLGLLPYAKLQTVPMGLLLGGAAIYLFIKQKQHSALLALLAGSLLPTALVVGYYARYETVTAFFNDYFWNYYYYSFTTVYSGVAVESRFGVRYVGRLFLQHRYQRVFWLVSGLWLLLGLYCRLFFSDRISGLRGLSLFRKKNPANPEILSEKNLSEKNLSEKNPSRFVYGLCGLFFLTNAYAAIQAGNLYAHYTLFVLPALLLLVALLNSTIPANWQRVLVPVFLSLMVLEGLNNLRLFTLPVPFANLERIDGPVRQWLGNQVRPGHKMTIWGYADRHFVWARRAAGNRLSHTFWAYWPSPLLTYRQQELMQDLEANKTDWLLDMLCLSHSDLDPIARIDQTPGLAGYVARHYRLVDTVQGVRIYKRM